MATELTWLGHGSWGIETDGHKLLLDPFFDDSPTAPIKSEQAEADFILISHGHYDHIADAAKVAQRTGALCIGIFEIATWLEKQGVEKTHGMNLGGGFDFPFGRAKLTLAFHSSVLPDGSSGGSPAGFLLSLKDGHTIYFACDTALFSDMKLIGAAGIDLAVLPIGDNYTMGPDDALQAVKLIEPKRVAPAHYNTWPPIAQDAQAWAARVKAETNAEPIVVEPGGQITL